MKERTNTSGPIAVLLAVLIGLCGCFSFGVTKRLMEYRDDSRRHASAKSDPYYVEAYLKYHRGSLALLGKNVSFARLLITDPLDPSYDDALAAANQELAIRLKAYKNIEVLSILTKQGTVIASSDMQDVGALKRSASVRAASDGGDKPLDVCTFVSEEDESFAVLVPVRVAGEIVGLVIGRLGTVDAY